MSEKMDERMKPEIDMFWLDTTICVKSPNIPNSDMTGHGSHFVPVGTRWFMLVLDEELGTKLMDQGWKVHIDRDGNYCLMVWIDRGKFQGLNTWTLAMHTIHIRGLAWEYMGKQGIKAFLDSYELEL